MPSLKTAETLKQLHDTVNSLSVDQSLGLYTNALYSIGGAHSDLTRVKENGHEPVEMAVIINGFFSFNDVKQQLPKLGSTLPFLKMFIFSFFCYGILDDLTYLGI